MNKHRYDFTFYRDNKLAAFPDLVFAVETKAPGFPALDKKNTMFFGAATEAPPRMTIESCRRVLDWNVVSSVCAISNMARVTKSVGVRNYRDIGDAVWKLQDGYGVAGFTPPQGWDWSGIRDSSWTAVRNMANVIRKAFGWKTLYPEEGEFLSRSEVAKKAAATRKARLATAAERAKPKPVRLGNAWTCASCKHATLEKYRTRPSECGSCGKTSFTGFVTIWRQA